MENKDTRILIVDDDVEMGIKIKEYLDDFGYNNKFINDGHQFSNSVNSYDPHVILMDTYLNDDLFGYRICEKLRESEGMKRSIIGMSSIDSVKLDWLENKADDFISKPNIPDVLDNIIQETMKKYQ